MIIIQFVSTTFRALFPAFANQVAFPDEALQIYWNTATDYINNRRGGAWCGWLKYSQQVLALNQMTAHLAALNQMIASGQTPGMETAATIDKISVTLTPPPLPNQWEWWLGTTPYGQQLLALLKSASVGGAYFSVTSPVVTAFRN